MEQREVDNMLLSMIQKHFPSLPLSDEHTDWGKWLGFARAVYGAGRASPASAPEGFNHSIGADRFTTVRGTYWWHVRAGDGTQNIGKFHTKLAAEDMALTLLTAFRDGAFMQYGAMLGPAPTPQVTEDQKDADRLNYLQEHGATVHLVSTTNSNLLSFVIGGLHRSKRLNLREAIDAAMQEDKP